jgi:hypothetical protein
MKDTVMHQAPIGTPVKKPKTVGDGNHSAGSGGTHKYCEQEHKKNFQGSGVLRPPTGDGRDAGMDGVVEGSVNVPRTQIFGKHDPVDGKK